MSLSFSFIDDGDKQAVPVVFLHAFPYHSGMWQPQRTAMRDRVRFLAFDVRGLGTRKDESSAYMIDHTVDDLFALLDHLGIAEAALCGLSMGGYAALRAVERSPERVSALILANTQAPGDSDAARLGRAEGVRILARDGAQAFVTQQIKKQLSPATQQSRPEVAALLTSLTKNESANGIAASLVAISTRGDQSGKLAAIRVPTCVLAGADDAVTPPNLAEFLANGIPFARLHVLSGAGHLSNLEAEADFNRIVLEFLAR